MTIPSFHNDEYVGWGRDKVSGVETFHRCVPFPSLLFHAGSIQSARENVLFSSPRQSRDGWRQNTFICTGGTWKILFLATALSIIINSMLFLSWVSLSVFLSCLYIRIYTLCICMSMRVFPSSHHSLDFPSCLIPRYYLKCTSNYFNSLEYDFLHYKIVPLHFFFWCFPFFHTFFYSCCVFYAFVLYVPWQVEDFFSLS